MNTEKINKIIQDQFSTTSEKNRKILLRVPGMKGDINSKIIPKYKSKAKLVENDGLEIESNFKFTHKNLGNHPRNNDNVTFYINMEREKIMLSTSQTFGSFAINMKLYKHEKDFLKDILTKNESIES